MEQRELGRSQISVKNGHGDVLKMLVGLYGSSHVVEKVHTGVLGHLGGLESKEIVGVAVFFAIVGEEDVALGFLAVTELVEGLNQRRFSPEGQGGVGQRFLEVGDLAFGGRKGRQVVVPFLVGIIGTILDLFGNVIDEIKVGVFS